MLISLDNSMGYDFVPSSEALFIRQGIITFRLLMLASSDKGPRAVIGMITFLLLMLASSDNGARGSDGDDYVLSPDALFIRQRGQGK